MRTTLTIDDDVAALLAKENRQAHEPMKQTVNRLLRAGLNQTARKPAGKRFVVEPIQGFQLPREWTSGSVQELLDLLDRPGTR